MKKTVPFLLAVLLVSALGGCSKYNEDRGRGDAPIGETNEAKRDVYEFPDQYANIAVACDGTSRMYVTTRKGDVAATLVVIPDSPECGPG